MQQMRNPRWVSGGGMKERPILFNSAMVQALLDGRKTQTRRIAKLNLSGRAEHAGKNWHVDDPNVEKACPYGQSGDRLWVRETWATTGEFADMKISELGVQDTIFRDTNIAYRADGDGYNEVSQAWRPSIHMPRWASRITLEITGVRIERLSRICAEDAKAEGLKALSKDDGQTIKYGIPDRDGWPGEDNYGWPWHRWRTDPRISYATLWESIHGIGSWDANPLVWVIEFRISDEHDG